MDQTEIDHTLELDRHIKALAVDADDGLRGDGDTAGAHIVAADIIAALAAALGHDGHLAPGVVGHRVAGGVGDHILRSQHGADGVDNAAKVGGNVEPETAGPLRQGVELGSVRADHMGDDPAPLHQGDHGLGGKGGGASSCLPGLMIIGIGDQHRHLLAGFAEGELARPRQTFE